MNVAVEPVGAVPEVETAVVDVIVYVTVYSCLGEAAANAAVTVTLDVPIVKVAGLVLPLTVAPDTVQELNV